MSLPKLPAWPPHDVEIEEALAAVWRDGSWGRYHGRFVAQLERALADFHSTEFARTCSSGTIAVELGLIALGVRPGSEVVLSAYDFPGNFRCIEQVGARPVLIDVDPTSGCIDADRLDEACSDLTTAVIVSHLHGGLASMRRIVAWARMRKVAILEDACQAPGARVDGRLVGTWGDVATLSFGGSKLLTAGRGGAVITNRAECVQRMKVYAERGNDAYPMSELQAAVLLPQLQRLPERNALRASAAACLRQELEPIAGITWIGTTAQADHQPSYYKVGLRIDEEAGQTRAEWLATVRERGVPVAAGFSGFFRRSERRCRRVGPLDHAQWLAERLVVCHHPPLLLGPEAMPQLARAMRTERRSGP